MTAPPSARWTVTPEEMAFATMFGLAPQRASLLASMISGKPISALAVHIHALRRALESEAIDTTPRGYQLTEIGREQCHTAITEFRTWVMGSKRKAA